MDVIYEWSNKLECLFLASFPVYANVLGKGRILLKRGALERYFTCEGSCLTRKLLAALEELAGDKLSRLLRIFVIKTVKSFVIIAQDSL